MNRLALVAVLGALAPLAQASEELAQQSGCIACHAADKAGVGPSWQDIATRYKDDAEAPTVLAAAVRNGSKGKWGGQIPMMPVPAERLSDENLATLVAWVLKR